MKATRAEEREVEALIDAAADKRFRARLAAHQRLAQLGESAASVLIRALNGPQRRQREAAAKALVAIGQPVAPHLLEAMKYCSDSGARWTMACLLSDMDRPEVRQVVCELTQEQVDACKARQHWLAESRQEASRKALRYGMAAASFIITLTSALVLVALKG